MNKGQKGKKNVRVSLGMYREDYEELKAIAQEEGKTLSGYLKTVLAIQQYVSSKQKEGATFMIDMPVRKWGIKTREVREIIFP